MEAFGINETLVAGFQMNFPTGNNMLVYLFDSDAPTDFNDMGFAPTAANLIRNCSNAVMANISYPTVRELQLTQRSSLIKGGDLVAKYIGEAVSVYENGSLVGSSFPDHAVYAPKAIINKGDYRDHKMFELCMYKQASDLNFAGAASYITVSTDANETIEFDYDRPVEANCFGIKQGTAANTFMRQMVLERWDADTSEWVEIVTTVLNVAGYQIVRFAPVTATRFRVRKLASGAAGTVTLAFAYFGKFGHVPGDLMYSMAVPKWAVVVPDFTAAAVMTGIQNRLLDMYGNNTVITEDFCIMVDASDLLGTGRLRINPPVQVQRDYKFDYYLAFGQLF